MPIMPEHYIRVDWLPCPDCWNEWEYQTEQYLIVNDDIVEDEDGKLVTDPAWEPDLDDPWWGQGYTVEVDRDAANQIVGRTFRGCPNCGGSGEHVTDGDSTGQRWSDWAFGGEVIEGSGKVSKLT